MSAVAPLLVPPVAGEPLAGPVASAAGFVPELDLAHDPVAMALARIVARDLELVAEGLNGLPRRSRLAFADACANALMPAAAARVPLVLKLLDTAPTDVTLPAGSRVAARLPPPAPSLAGEATAPAATEAVFATEETVTLARGKLAALYTIDPASDTWTDHRPGLEDGAVLFADGSAVQHALHLGHDDHFRLAGTAEITVGIDLRQDESPGTRRPILLDWAYLTGEGWLPLVVTSDTTARLTQDGIVILRKECGPDAVEGVIGGRKSYWIRAQVSDRAPSARIVAATGTVIEVEDARDLLPGDIVTVDGQALATVRLVGTGRVTLNAALGDVVPGYRLRLADALPPLRPEGSDDAGALPLMDVIRIAVGFEKSGIAPDAAALNTSALAIEQRFLPFGARPEVNDTFFLACKEAFQRVGASIRIRARLLQPGVPDTAKPYELRAQYWNGRIWSDFPAFLELAGTRELLTSTDPLAPPELRFRCPDDWAESEVNGVKGHWLKLLLAQGDFGTPQFSVVQPTPTTVSVVEVPGKLVPPVVDGLDIAYVYATRPAFLDHCVALNDFVHSDHTEDCRWPRRPFAPFVPVQDRAPAIHMGFTQKLPVGLVSLLVAGAAPDALAADPAPYVFEYRSARGWSELPVRDGSGGFRSLGLLQLIGPGDAVPVDGQGGLLYRLRARLKPGSRAEPTPIDGLWLNAVWASHASATTSTVIGMGDGGPDLTLASRPQDLPVLPGERVELREWAGRGDDWATVVPDVDAADLRFERDPVDRTTPRALWVRWHARPHLAASGPGDRHYLIDRTSGVLRFGDGRHGRIPPAGATVAIAHEHGGGLDGNVGVDLVNELRSSAGYLEGVRNPLPASGGASGEVFGALVERAAARLRHRDRAVAAADFAWAAREASPEVARAVALPATGPDGAVQPGWVGLVLVPRTVEPQPQPSQALRQRVMDHLRVRTPLGIARRIRLVDPDYASLAVTAELVVRDAAAAAAVEARLRSRLNTWLHAIVGGDAGEGWPFGATLELSAVARLVVGVPGVVALTRLGWQQDGTLVTETVTLDGHVLPAPGDHQLKLVMAAG